MKIASAIRLAVGSALLVGVLPVGTAAAATTVYVGKTNCTNTPPGGTASHPWCTIQEGVNAASPSGGDTVSVGKGTYTEAVTVDRTLSLVGNHATVTASGADGVVLSADNILVIGFTFSGKSDGPAMQTLGTHSGYTIRNNLFTNNVFGLYLNSSGTHVTNVLFNHFTGNNQAGSASGNGIYSDQGLHNVLVDQNVFENQSNTSMIVANGGIASDHIRFSRNLAQNGSGTGVFLDQVNDSTVSNSTFRNLGGNGVTLIETGSNNVVRDNVMQKSYRGLRVGGADVGLPGSQTNLLVDHNTISQSTDSVAPGGTNGGIYISTDAMMNSTVSNNMSNSNLGDGILVDSGMNTGNAFDQNTLRHNGNKDAEDRTTGSGTAGTANSWDRNHCVTSSPPGLCATP